MMKKREAELELKCDWPSTEKMKAQIKAAFPSFDEIEAADQRKDKLRREAVSSANSLLREVRRIKGYPQSELAARMDVSQPAVSQVERADLDSNGQTLSSLVDHLNYCGHRLVLSAVPIDEIEQDRLGDCGPRDPDFPAFVDTLDICYLETDCSDRIVRSNSTWKKLHTAIEGWTENVLFEDFLKAGIDNGLFPSSFDEDRWLEKRMERHLAPSKPFDVVRQRGTILEVSETRKADGGVITVGKNVTIQRMVEQLGSKSSQFNQI